METCNVCEKNAAKYKCPTCRQSYCSAPCCKSHKITGCNPVNCVPTKDSTEKSQVKYDYPTEDTVPVEKLKCLRQSEELRNCLKNLHVRDIMKMILNASDPTKAIEQAMVEPAFVEMVDACLKVVEPPDEFKPY